MKNFLHIPITIVGTIIASFFANIAISKYSEGNLEYQIKSANYESVKISNNYEYKQCTTLINLNIENNSNFNEKNIQVKFTGIHQGLLDSIELNSNIKNIDFNKTRDDFIRILELRQKEKAKIQIKFTGLSCIDTDTPYLENDPYISSDSSLAQKKQKFFDKYSELTFMMSSLGVLFIIILCIALAVDILTPKEKKIASLEKQVMALKDEIKNNKK